MKTDFETENLRVLMNLLGEAREEADGLRRRVQRYENILLSTKLLMGHDLKKPTTALTGYLELAMEALDDSSGKEKLGVLECLRKARRECELVNELNVTFLSLLRLSEDKENLPVQTINIEELLREVIDCFPEKFYAAERVELCVIPKAKDIQFNLNALKLIVSNLIENALLYSKSDAKVIVKVDKVTDKRQLSNRELMQVTVKDDGVGIPKDDLQKIFKPFVRLHQDGVEGAGLGLTLVRSLVELHGGEISVNSSSGMGTTVFLTVPVMLESQEQMVL